MSAPQIVTLSSNRGEQLFMVWEPPEQEFLTIDNRSRWLNWQEFKQDLRKHWNDHVDEGGSHTDQRFWEYLQAYERHAPTRLKSPGSAVQAAGREKKNSGGLWLTGGVLAFFLLMVGSLLWEQGVAPMLGHLGVIEYKSPAQARYERFISEVSSCKPQKTVSLGAKNQVPAFQPFTCAGGEEKIWAYQIEVVKRSDSGAWVIDP